MSARPIRPQAVAAFVAVLLLAPVLGADPATGRVLRVEIEERTPVLDGRAFGEVGAYELLRGRIYFAFDPADPVNDAVVDIEHAPTDSLGRVRAWANFAVLQPVDPERRQGVALVEVSNRGGKFSMASFNRATASLDASDPDAFGDGLLMRRGMTVLWVGWQWDVPRGEDRLRLRVPVATGEGGRPLRGLVRSDWVVDDSAAVLPIGHRDHTAYRPVRFQDEANVLTVRTGREAPRQVVPRSRWHFGRRAADGSVVPDSTHITLEGGFMPGRIYELVYRAERPRVVGLGLAAIRDVITYAKYDAEAPFPVDKGIAVGVSQTGRFLRHFLYQGFNTDAEGRQAYDGLYAITAGAGRGSFNHRFAQPSRDAHRYSAFFYPTDLFPFTSATQVDSLQWRSDGLLAHLHRPEHAPKTFFLNNGYEYYGRAASLIHTSPDGRRDVAPAETERIYHVAGAQHFPWGTFPPPEETRLREGPALHRGNPLDQSVVYRALLVQMIGWVDRGTPPPPSRYPRHADGTLVPVGELAFPALPGIDPPKVVHRAYRADYGPRWRTDGVVTQQPPRLGPAYGSRVPQVDSLGNERGGIRLPALQVPLATYMPWVKRLEAPAQTGELDDFWGGVSPFPATPARRAETGDPRPAATSLYAGREAYLGRVRAAANRLIRDGFLLTSDRQRVLERAAARWDWVVEGR
jgi:hypothetical protein